MSALPQLRQISITELSRFKGYPVTKIKSDEDVNLWKTTQGYQDYGLFLRRLNEAVVGYHLPWTSSSPSPGVAAVVALLDKLDKWIDRIPPQSSPQRFGNLAFRTWGQKLEENVHDILSSMLPSQYRSVIPHLAPYLLISFGSFTRMDYGTGHETSFALFLLCLSLVRFLNPGPEEEREIVLILFVRYLHLCWRLQDVYNLEPAGSQGVWGLDDYSFLGYLFGSSQLQNQTDIAVSAILDSSLPPTNLYFMQILRIHQFKHGPFHEHSSQLHSIAVGVPNWSKVNSGLFKMYEGEVLSKRVVVQHIPLGGLLDWNPNPSSLSYHAMLPQPVAPRRNPGITVRAGVPLGLIPAPTYRVAPANDEL